jgi:hypothetical protein
VHSFVIPEQRHARLDTYHQRKHTSSLPTQISLYKPNRLYPRKSKAIKLQLLPSITELGESLFSYTGNVPFWQAFGLNAMLFALLSKKLLKSLTPEGFAHSFALGTLLWTTLGWRGWSLCVLYLAAGNLVTKVRFAEKEKRGLAEKRGGRRGPENVWYVTTDEHCF